MTDGVHDDKKKEDDEEEQPLLPPHALDVLGDPAADADAAVRLEAALGPAAGFSYPRVCARLAALCVGVWRDVLLAHVCPRAPLRGAVPARVRTVCTVPFGEPWSVQLDMSFETAPDGTVACPDAHALAPAVRAAWRAGSPSAGAHYHAEWLLRCYTALAHEAVHVVQNAVGFRDRTPGGWRAEYGASALAGPGLVAAALYAPPGSTAAADAAALFPGDARAALHALLAAWERETAHLARVHAGTAAAAALAAWTHSAGAHVPPRALLETPGAAYYLKTCVGAAGLARFLALAEHGGRAAFDREFVALAEHCLVSLSDLTE